MIKKLKKALALVHTDEAALIGCGALAMLAIVLLVHNHASLSFLTASGAVFAFLIAQDD